MDLYNTSEDESPQFKQCLHTLKKLVVLWKEIHESVYSVLFCKEQSDTERVLKTIILLVYRTEVMKSVYDLTIATLALARSKQSQDMLTEVLEKIHAELRNDFEQTRTAMLLN